MDRPSPNATGGAPQAKVSAYTLRTPELAVLLSLSGAVTYVVVRVAETRFYMRFGVQPEEVGLTYAETLARSATTVVAEILVCSLVFGLFGLVLLYRDRPQLRPLVVVLFVVWTGFAAYWTIADPPDSLVAALLGLFPFVVGWCALATEVPKQALQPTTWRRIRIAGVVAPVLGAALVLVLTAESESNAVAQGNGFESETLGVPNGTWSSEAVTLWSSDQRVAARLARYGCVMYLGKNDGTAVAYDPETHSTIRFRTDSVVLESHPDYPVCE